MPLLLFGCKGPAFYIVFRARRGMAHFLRPAHFSIPFGRCRPRTHHKGRAGTLPVLCGPNPPPNTNTDRTPARPCIPGRMIVLHGCLRPASLWACVYRFTGTGGESLPYDVSRGRLLVPARRIGQRWRATRAPKPVVYGGEGPASCRASHTPRRYPQSDKRSIVESADADGLPLRRRDRKNGHECTLHPFSVDRLLGALYVSGLKSWWRNGR